MGPLVACLIFVIVWFGFLTIEEVAVPEFASAATNSAITVTASVTSSLSCEVNISSVDIGTLSDQSITTASTDATTTMACANESNGCTLYLIDVGTNTQSGLFNATGSSLIESPNLAFSASATLVAGTEGYGIQATTSSTTGSGDGLYLGLRYAVIGDDVGGLATETTALANSNSSTTGREVTVSHKAAISAATAAGVYEDTITYSCLAN